LEKIPVSEGEYRVLERLASLGISEGEISSIAREISVPEATLHSIAMLLQDRGLATVIVDEKSVYRLTEKGVEALSRGLPEERLVKLLEDMGPM